MGIATVLVRDISSRAEQDQAHIHRNLYDDVISVIDIINKWRFNYLNGFIYSSPGIDVNLSVAYFQSKRGFQKGLIAC